MDWKRKLTSRKFWLAVIGFVTQLMIMNGAADSQITQVAACIMAGATLIGYIIGEGLADAGGSYLEPEVIGEYEVDEKEEAVG